MRFNSVTPINFRIKLLFSSKPISNDTCATIWNLNGTGCYCIWSFPKAWFYLNLWLIITFFSKIANENRWKPDYYYKYRLVAGFIPIIVVCLSYYTVRKALTMKEGVNKVCSDRCHETVSIKPPDNQQLTYFRQWKMSQKICFTREDGKVKNWVDRYEDPRYKFWQILILKRLKDPVVEIWLLWTQLVESQNR